MSIVAITGSVTAPVQSDVQAGMRAFLLDLFPSATVIAAQANRAAKPATGNFIVMTPIDLERLSTNFEQGADVRAIGSIAANIFTVTSVPHGTIVIGNPLDGT